MSHRFLVPTIDAGEGDDWLLNDNFTTPDAAPIQSALATAGSATVGVETNTYTATHADDGTNWEIAEVAATPGFTLTMDFTAPVRGQNASRLVIHGYYDGNIGHTVNVDAYDWVTTSYDNLGTLPDAVAEAVYTFTLDADHTDSDGSVKIRINHTSPGNINHDLYLDYVYIQDLVRKCEPTGTLTLIQEDGTFSISGGALNFAAQSTPTWGDFGFHDSTARTRAAGLSIFHQINYTNSSKNSVAAAWFKSTTITNSNAEAGVREVTDLFKIQLETAVVDTGLALAISTDYTIVTVLRAAGSLTFIKGGAFASWQLLWIDDSKNTATLYPGYTSYDSAGSSDYFRVAQMSIPFNTDFGYTTDRDAGTVAESATFTHEANTLLEFTATTVPSAGNIDVFFRIQDADNYWIARVTTGGTLDLIEVVATAETSRGSGGTVTDGERIVIIANDDDITGYADNATAWTYASATNFKTETDGELNSLGTAGAVDDLATYPIFPSDQALAQLNKHTKP